jgi:hypothetical protein
MRNLKNKCCCYQHFGGESRSDIDRKKHYQVQKDRTEEQMTIKEKERKTPCQTWKNTMPDVEKHHARRGKTPCQTWKNTMPDSRDKERKKRPCRIKHVQD